MKRILCVLIALLLAMLCLTSCLEDVKGIFKDIVDDMADAKDAEEEEEKPQVVIPAGYVQYDNGVFSFAYPEDWSETDDGDEFEVTFSSENGDSVNVIKEESYTDFEDMTVQEYEDTYLPIYEDMGLIVTDVDVTHMNVNGVKLTRVTQSVLYSEIRMEQMMLVFTFGEWTYTVTVTETGTESVVAEVVLDTLQKSE